MSKHDEDIVVAAANRERVIVRTSVIGILTNVLLAGFKAAVGLLSHSIAVTLDAVNNLSDALSSIITIVGTKLAGKLPDKKHPLGYGRIEYLSAMIVSGIVLYAGITSLVESIKKIIHPETPDYSAVSLVIVGIAVLVKIFLGRYVKSVGQKVNSDSLINSGADASLDALISAATLVAALVFVLFKVSLDAWLGALISLVIIKSGVDMLQGTISKILGEGADAELARSIKKTIAAYPGVSGVYDLVLHNYGPDAFNGSVHIEVPDTYSANELDKLIRTISLDVYEKHHVALTAIGVYSVNTRDPRAIEVRERVRELVMSTPYVLQMHGFYMDEAEKTLRFDFVISFEAEDRAAVYREVCGKVQQAFPDYTLQITMDTDFT